MITSLSNSQRCAAPCVESLRVENPLPSADAPERDDGVRIDPAVAERKMGLLKRFGLFGDDSKGAVVSRARSFEDLRAAYRLVHDVYLGTGYIKPEPAGIRLRIFETSSETATFIAKKDGRVVGVLSVVADSSDLGLPSDEAFANELNHLRAQGRRLCELTNQVVADGFRKSAVPTELMRCAVAHAMEAGFDEGVAAVSPSHNGFYDLMGFRQVGSERSYSHKLHDPVVALSMDFDRYRGERKGMCATEQFIYRFATIDNPHIVRLAGWTREARAQFLNPEMLAGLFVRERNFIAECSPADRARIERRWGAELFAVVTETWTPAEVSDAGRETVPAREARSGRTPHVRTIPEVFTAGDSPGWFERVVGRWRVRETGGACASGGR